MESKWNSFLAGKRLNGWKQRWKDKGLEKWLKRDNLIILVLSGILLVIIALPMEKDGKKDNVIQNENGTPVGVPQPTSEAKEEMDEDWEKFSEEEYSVWLEQRLTEALGQVAGVGEVRVMITLKSSRELVVEREESVSRSSTNESDSQGGSRTISQVETGESVVYSSAGTYTEPYVIKTLQPKIEGVLVVAEGAGNGTVNRTITSIVQALFDVEPHKVSVVRMEKR